MTHLPRDFLDVASASDYLTGSGGARSFQSLAERFERIDDEVRRLEASIDPGGDSVLARTKVDRMALLQAIAMKIVEVPADLSDRVGMRINSNWNAVK